MSDSYYEYYLEHHGIKGQKWGDRKYQYADGSLTPEGRLRYGTVGKNKKIKSSSLNKERKALTEKLTKKNANYIKSQELKKEAEKLASNNDFDGEHGGTSKSSKTSAKKYLDNYAKSDELRELAISEAKKEANRIMTKKYGTKRMEDLEVKNKSKSYAIMSSMAAVPIAVIAFSIKH